MPIVYLVIIVLLIAVLYFVAHRHDTPTPMVPTTPATPVVITETIPFQYYVPRPHHRRDWRYNNYSYPIRRHDKLSL